MNLQGAVLLLAHCSIATASSGFFWHITDLHFDPLYKVTTDPLRVCPSAGSQPVMRPGVWGDYLCDSPWILINSSIYAMKKIFPNPDFILWTGDDTPHVPDEEMSEPMVLDIIRQISNIIRLVFPGIQVYAAMGNHDFHPKNQFPAVENKIYSSTAEFWSPWLSKPSVFLFKSGAFYSQLMTGPGPPRRVIALNTNLYYDSNHATATMKDPAGQFQWLEDTLNKAAEGGEKVYIIGHVPPGFFEKKRGKPWFREQFNQRYIEIIQKHHKVIVAQFMGHHHTDSFRLFYDKKGSPISVMFLAPAVTPWKTTLPGVHNGANNPGIRLFTYDRDTLLVQDMVTYYLNLAEANLWGPKWEKEYSLTDDFDVGDGSASSMHTLLGDLVNDDSQLQRYYRYNSVQYDRTRCDNSCRIDHICAIREVDFTRYDLCLQGKSGAPTAPVLSLLFCGPLMGLVALGLLWGDLNRLGH